MHHDKLLTLIARLFEHLPQLIDRLPFPHRRHAGIVTITLGHISSGRTWQQAHPADHSADQPLDVTAVVRALAIDELNAVLAAAALERLALELGRAVQVQSLGQPSHRPVADDTKLLEPGGLG